MHRVDAPCTRDKGMVIGDRIERHVNQRAMLVKVLEEVGNDWLHFLEETVTCSMEIGYGGKGRKPWHDKDMILYDK